MVIGMPVGDERRIGATLLVGGAGTGKTTLLEQRAVELLRAHASGVTVLARNRTAARRMRVAIARDIGSTDALTVTTFHAFALSLLTQGWPLSGSRAEPSLISAPEQFALVSEMLARPDERRRWEAIYPRALRLSGFADELREFVLRAQDAGESPDQLAERAAFVDRPHLREAVRFYGRYLEEVRSRDVIDHAGVIRVAGTLVGPSETDTRELAHARRELVARIRRAGHHLLVDDVQVATPAMLNLLAAVADPEGSTTAAFDPEAPSFGFRGSSEGADVRFDARFWPVERIDLARRWRPEPTITSHRVPHAVDERTLIVNEVRRAHGDLKLAWGDIAIIVRRLGPEVAALRRALERARIPVTVVGENRALNAEPALAPMLDLAACAFDVTEREARLPAILAWPMFGIDSFDLRQLRAHAKRSGDVGLNGLLAAPPADLRAPLRDTLIRLRTLLDQLVEHDLTETAHEVWWWLWTTLPQFADLVADDDAAGLDAVEAFGSAIARATERNPEQRFSAVLEAMTSSDFGPQPFSAPEEHRPDSVRILTAFGALGREFDLVLVPGCVDGNFPSRRVRTPMIDVRDLLAPADHVARRREAARREEQIFHAVVARARQRVILTAGGEAPVSPVAELRDLRFADPVPDPPAALFTRDEFEALQRRTLCDPDADPARIEEALRTLARLRGVEPDDWWHEQEWTSSDLAIRTEPFKTSFSKLEKYENCPLQYLYASEALLDQSTSHHLSVGVWVHDVFELAARAKLDGVPPVKEQMVAWLDERWDPSVFENVAIEHRRRIESEEMIDKWLKTEVHHPIAAAEEAFAFEAGNATIRGRIDRIDVPSGGGCRVIDYKTGRSAPSAEQAAESLQMGMYALAVERDPNLRRFAPVHTVTLSYPGVWASRQNGGPGYVRHTSQPDDEQTTKRLVAIIDGINEGRFAPSGDAECRNCPMKPLCPLWPEGNEVTL